MEFTTGSSIVVKTQNGYKGPDVDASALKATDFLRFTGRSGSISNGTYYSYAAGWANGGLAQEENNHPAVKVASISFTWFGKFSVEIDWRDANLLETYNEKGSYAYYTDAGNQPCTNFSPNFGIWRKYEYEIEQDPSNDNSYSYSVTKDGVIIQRYTGSHPSNMTITVTSTTGKVYELTTDFFNIPDDVI